MCGLDLREWVGAQVWVRAAQHAGWPEGGCGGGDAGCGSGRGRGLAAGRKPGSAQDHRPLAVSPHRTGQVRTGVQAAQALPRTRSSRHQSLLPHC